MAGKPDLLFVVFEAAQEQKCHFLTCRSRTALDLGDQKPGCKLPQGGGGAGDGVQTAMPCFWFQSDHVRLPGHVQTSDPPPQRLPAPGQRECHPIPRPCRTPACPFLSRAPGPLSVLSQCPRNAARSPAPGSYLGALRAIALAEEQVAAPFLPGSHLHPQCRPHIIRDPRDATQCDDGHRPPYSRNFPENEIGRASYRERV